MIPVRDAQAQLLALVRALGPPRQEMISVAASAGRILAEDCVAQRDQPPFASSAMDGYAVQWQDISQLPATLTVIGESHAGKRFSGALRQGEAVRIFTGAPVPEGADTIVVQEETARSGDQVTITGRPENLGGHIRRAGLDCTVGKLIAHKGEKITAARAGFIAAAAIFQVTVAKSPRVDLVMCGDELRLPGQPLGHDQIVSTNGLMLAGLLQSAGADVIGADNIVPDDLAALTATLAHSDAQLIVTAGGASVGERDFVQQAIIEAGGRIDFWKIAMRPGKPLMVAQIKNKIIIGLPGNPVSAFVGAILFVLPAVRALQGALHVLPDIQRGHWAQPHPANGPRTDYVRATVARQADGLGVRALPVQDSSMLSVLAAANALAIVPAGASAAIVGDPVDLILLPE